MKRPCHLTNITPVFVTAWVKLGVSNQKILSRNGLVCSSGALQGIHFKMGVFYQC